MESLTLEMSDGVKVHVIVKRPEGKIIGHMHVLHGLAEHSGRYTETMNHFAERGYLVTAHDHRGHGRTAEMNGKRGYFAAEHGFRRIVEDAFEVITHIQHRYTAPYFVLFGHSMGSFIARRFIQVYGEMVDVTVLSGTGDDARMARLGGQGIAHLLGKKSGYSEPNPLLDELVFGRFNRSVEKPLTKFDWISDNPSYVFSYLSDEYCGFIPTTQLFLDLFAGLEMIHDEKEVNRIPKELPILLFAGTEDPVGNFGKSLWTVAKQYDAAKIENVTVLLFDGGRHELIGDPNRPAVVQFVEEWIEENVK